MASYGYFWGIKDINNSTPEMEIATANTWAVKKKSCLFAVFLGHEILHS